MGSHPSPSPVSSHCKRRLAASLGRGRGEGGSFVCLPAPGAAGGSHDSVLPKKGKFKARPLRLVKGTTPSSSPLCPLPISPPSASGKAGQGLMNFLLVAWAWPSTLPQICSIDLLPCRQPWVGTTAHGLRLEGQPCRGDLVQGWEDLFWPPEQSLGLLPGKRSLLLLFSLSQPCPSPPASHISASELLAPPRAAAAAAAAETTAPDRH